MQNALNSTNDKTVNLQATDSRPPIFGRIVTSVFPKLFAFKHQPPGNIRTCMIPPVVFWEVLHNLPKLLKLRYYLKKKPFHDYEKETGKKAILGVRSEESLLRKTQYTSCFTSSGKFTPIHDLTQELEDKIIKQYNIEVPKIYDYIDRTGCAGCPYGSWKGETEKELELMTDAKREYVTNLFKESYDILGVNYKKE